MGAVAAAFAADVPFAALTAVAGAAVVRVTGDAVTPVVPAFTANALPVVPVRFADCERARGAAAVAAVAAVVPRVRERERAAVEVPFAAVVVLTAVAVV